MSSKNIENTQKSHSDVIHDMFQNTIVIRDTDCETVFWIKGQ